MANSIATAADYADALSTARKAKGWLFVLLLLVLLLQLGIFFTALYSDVLQMRTPRPVTATADATAAHSDAVLAAQVESPEAQAPATPAPETQTVVTPLPDAVESAEPETAVETPVQVEPTPEPAVTPTEPVEMTPTPIGRPAPTATESDISGRNVAIYLIGVSNFLGIGLAVILAMVILLIVKIMLIGRLIGVSRLTSAYIWSLLLIVLLLPWQAMFPFNFPIPGVLYTWAELNKDVGSFPEGFSFEAILKWARYVVFPVLALVILLMVQIKSNRGLKQALGEAGADEPPVA